jgi:flagellum-specific peptidoglycan hydrolase FlgJ
MNENYDGLANKQLVKVGSTIERDITQEETVKNTLLKHGDWALLFVFGLVIFAFNQGDLEIRTDYSHTDTIYQLADFSAPEIVEFRARNKEQQLQVDYIERYLNLAKTEAKLFHIPVSIILGQGILESKSGKSPVAQKYSNHFGVMRNDKYQMYLSVWASYRDHSKVLNLPIYKHLHGKDYKGWAVGLYEAGYAKDEAYAEKLINVIEQWGLQRYD